MCRLPKEILATVFRVLASSEDIGSSAKITGSSWGGKGRPEQIPDLLCRHPRAGC
jgi:hypothetical protein